MQLEDSVQDIKRKHLFENNVMPFCIKSIIKLKWCGTKSVCPFFSLFSTDSGRVATDNDCLQIQDKSIVW